jgi:hypothetical protein
MQKTSEFFAVGGVRVQQCDFDRLPKAKASRRCPDEACKPTPQTSDHDLIFRSDSLVATAIGEKPNGYKSSTYDWRTRDK